MLDSRKGWNKGDPSPHDELRERCKDGAQLEANPLDHELLLAFLEHHLKTGEPLDSLVVVTLAYDLEVAMTERDGMFFKKMEKQRGFTAGAKWGERPGKTRDTKPPIPSITAYYREVVVGYLCSAIKMGWSENDAVSVIAEACGVGNSTLRKWRKEHPNKQVALTEESFKNQLDFFRRTRHILAPGKHPSPK